MTGGTLNLNGNSQSVTQLGFSNNSTIDFGSQSGTNSFLFNSLASSPSGVLTINNFESGTDFFASKSTISQSVLDTLYFSGIGSGAAQSTSTTTIAGYGSGWLTIDPTGATTNWYLWDSGRTYEDNDWTTKRNWVGDGVPNPNAKVAFGTGTKTSVDLDANKTVNAIRFNGADDTGGNAESFTIGSDYGYTLTMGGTSTNASAIAFIQQKSTNDQTISVGQLALATNTVVDMIGSGNLTISAPISGSKNLVKEGTGGSLILSGDSGSGSTNYTGKVYINAGTLQITNSGALGATGGSYNTNIASGATLAISNNISSGEAITLEGAGVGGNGAIRNLSGTNTLSGALTLGSDSRIQSDSGTLTLSGAIGPSSFTHTFTLGGAGNITVSNVIGLGSGEVIVDGASTSAITTFSGSSANTYTGLTTVKGGTLTLAKTAGINAVAGDLTIGDNSGTAGSAIVKLTNANQIANTSSVTINSDGVLNLNSKAETIAKLTGTSSSAGIELGTTSGGSLTIAGTQSSEFAGSISGVGSIIKSGSGDLALSGNSTYSGGTTVQSGIVAALSTTALGTGTVTVQSSGNVELNNVSLANNFNLSGQGTYASDGAIQATAGTNTLSGTVTLAADSRIRADYASTLNVSNNVNIGSKTLTMAGAGDANYNAGIGASGSTGGITKIDSGTTTVSGTSNFSGTMAVNGGLLIMNGTAATNTINISGGTLKLGASERLSNSATVTVNSGSFDVNGKTETISSLSVQSSGTAALGSGTLNTASVNVASGGSLAMGTGTLITSSGGTISGLITGSGTLQTTSGATVTIATPQNFAGSIVVGSGSTVNLAASASGSTFGNLVLNGGTIYLGTGGTAGTQYSYNFSNIIVNQPSTIDFGNGISVTLSTNNLNLNNIATGGLTINNWVNLSDYFLAANWQGGVINGGTGQAPYNQIGFNGYNPNNTSWQPYGPGWGQITPVPEPSTYGAIFMGLCTAFVAFRRFFGRKQS